MRIVRLEDLESESLDKIVNRGVLGLKRIKDDVEHVVEAVRSRGDEALFEFTHRFDGVELDSGTVKATRRDLDEAYEKVKPVEVKALKRAASNIRRFHELQLRQFTFQWRRRNVTVGVVVKPISSVGIYAPGGKKPYPSSVLMCAVPARVAGVERVILCSPPSPEYRFNPYILVAADIAGVDEVYCVGGAQAIAAMAYGTQTLKPVGKIVGPGNIYVTAAKLMVSSHVAVDLPAGPSEILIITDDSVEAKFVAADLIAQAEHDERSTCILVTTSEKVAEEVNRNIEDMLKGMPNESIAVSALERNGLIIIVEDLKDAIAFTDMVAPEHLAVMTRRPQQLLRMVRNAGMISLGQYSPVAVSDYCVGTNHVLPTGRYSRTYSGLSVRDFLKTVSYVYCSKKGLEILADTTVTLANMEGLKFHAESIRVRKV
ncbi:MAG: histidinol dehydrogenase [Candidatus Bathyarchaeia archaeon]